MLNDEPISLFNSHNHTVMDVVLQAGINPSLFISKNGKALDLLIMDAKELLLVIMGKMQLLRLMVK